MPKQPEKPRPKIYFPEVRDIITNDFKIKWGLEQLKDIDDNGSTVRHSQRIANLGYQLAKKLNFSEEKTFEFVEACLLHDIGKISTPAEILNKAHDDFTEADMEVIRKHPLEGREILEMQGRPERVCKLVYLHHRFQDRYYPNVDIEADEYKDFSADARLLAMLDVYDTVVFGRPNIEPVSEGMRKIILQKQFHQPGDEEIIDFLIGQYEIINKLGKN